MKKTKKGTYGYIRRERVRRIARTVILFLIPLSAFVAAYLITGTRKNLITVVAMIGCLPACQSFVNTVMIWLQKPMDPAHYEEIEKHMGSLTHLYEVCLTSYEKNAFVECFALCGNKIVGYSSRLSGSAQFVEDHVKKIMKQNGYKVDVHVLKDLKPFTDRLDSLNAHREELTGNLVFRKDERYPQFTSREELFSHILQNISL